jgi:hypothetical protein
MAERLIELDVSFSTANKEEGVLIAFGDSRFERVLRYSTAGTWQLKGD